MPVKIKPTSEIKARLGIDPNGRVQKFFTSTCAKHMDKYVPYDIGNLADYRLQADAVIYHQPYAKYQYYGVREDGTHQIKKRNRSMHPQATSYWDRKMVTAEMPEIIKEVEKYIRRA